jgi:hypothetical protein
MPEPTLRSPMGGLNELFLAIMWLRAPAPPLGSLP